MKKPVAFNHTVAVLGFLLLGCSSSGSSSGSSNGSGASATADPGYDDFVEALPEAICRWLERCDGGRYADLAECISEISDEVEEDLNCSSGRTLYADDPNALDACLDWSSGTCADDFGDFCPAVTELDEACQSSEDTSGNGGTAGSGNEPTCSSSDCDTTSDCCSSNGLPRVCVDVEIGEDYQSRTCDRTCSSSSDCPEDWCCLPHDSADNSVRTSTVVGASPTSICWPPDIYDFCGNASSPGGGSSCGNCGTYGSSGSCCGGLFCAEECIGSPCCF